MTIVELNGHRPTGDDLPITLDFDGDEPGGAHPCTNHPAPSAVRDCIKCGATIFPYRHVQCSEGHFIRVPSLAADVADLGAIWCHECDDFTEVTRW